MYLYTKMKLEEVGRRGLNWTDLSRARDRWPELEPPGSLQWGEFIEELKIS